MRDLINWGVCERNFIRKVSPDLERVESIKKMALTRYERIKKYPDEDVSFLVEDYYEIIKEMLVAYLLKNGLRSQNHQCLISYLNKIHPELENEVDLISQMAFFRNRLGYYGEMVPNEFYLNKKEEFKRIIGILLDFLDEK